MRHLIPLFATLALTIGALLVWLLPHVAEKVATGLPKLMARQGLLLTMTTLAANKPRTYEIGDTQSIPMIANDAIYEGAAVGDNASGLARPLVAQDPFMGFAERTADNTGGAASALRVEVKVRGQIELPVTGAASAADEGEPVYASDDDTFTLTSTNNTAIGKVARWVSGTTCVVYFEAVSHRSI